MTTDATGTTGATRYDRRMYALMNRTEAVSWWATAGRRRAWVALHMVLTAALVPAWLGSVHGDSLPAVWALPLLTLPWCVAMGVINGCTRGLFELRGRMLDERQLAERDQVRAVAHRITTALLLAAATAAGLLTRLTDVRLDGLLFPVLFAALIVVWMTPRWTAALRVRGDLRDEAREDFRDDLHGASE
ncbi:hypothetical protein NX801_15685 [Streptomyces sp. LP05-1]|uniref:Integral membrane protein n=1 Tax=Streptomyces pyxinae TaxID=2970734 RepID=A0ABT2CI43_9ACTN|nr:hypothetical protein [Streptomyces sp. LP05-1]MCS0637077.1 hypothetical protein [Streptomyces sp. LP05-1]